MSDEDRGIWSLTFGRAFADSLSQAGAEYARMLDKLNQVTEPVRQFITAPRDPQCMASATGLGMAIGGGAGAVVGGFGGGVAGAGGGSIVAPGFGTIIGGYGGGAAGAAQGAALFGAGGGAVGRSIGLVTCMTATNSGGGSHSSKGSTGRTDARDLKEQLAMEQAQANPLAGQVLPITLKDSRWPSGAGWVKMRQNINGIVIHYVRNKNTGAVDDFKFK